MVKVVTLDCNDNMTPDLAEYETLTAYGRTCAKAMIDTLRDTENPNVLVAKMRSLVSSGDFGPEEIGFFTEIATRLICSRP